MQIITLILAYQAILGFCISDGSSKTELPSRLLYDSHPINWTLYNIDSNGGKFYNGDPCPIASDNFGWKELKNPDGSLYTAERRPITLVFEAWDSSYLTTYVMQYLLEVMGYNVQVVTHIAYDFGVEFQSNSVDLNLEVWPSDHANYFNATQIDHIAVPVGAVGYIGQFGIYTQKSVVTEHSDWDIDFWKFQKSEEAKRLFPKIGSSPVISPPECDDMPGQCMNGMYIPQQCVAQNASCFEIWGYDPSYSPGYVQRLIDGLNIPAAFKFLGFSAEDFFDEAIRNNRTIAVYSWVPTSFVATHDLARILYPEHQEDEWNAYFKDINSPLTSDAPVIVLSIVSSNNFLGDFPELHSMVSKFEITDGHMKSLLRDFKNNNLSYSQAACNWVKKNENIWNTWIPNLPVSIENCPVGFARVYSGLSFICSPCPENTYNLNPNNTGACKICEDGFTCHGGNFVDVNKGLWMSSNQNRSLTYHKCPVVEACCPFDSCPPETCNGGFTGLLCTECSDPDQYVWGTECRQCSSSVGGSFYAILFGAAICALVLLILPYEEAPTVEILFFYFQVTRYIFQSQTDGVLQIPGLSAFLDIASLNLEGFVSDCTLKVAGLSKQLFRFFLPAVIIFYIILLYVALKSLQSHVAGAADRISKLMPYYLKGQPISLICFRAIIVAMTFVVMPFVDASLNLINCVQIEGNLVVQSVPQIQCYHAEHNAFAAFAFVVLFLMLIILPGFLSALLYKLKRNNLINYDHDLPPIQMLFQCVYIIFKPEYFYMLPVSILEKGFISVMFTLMNQYSEKVQIDVYIMVLTLICATRIYVQPYKNNLEAYLNREVSLGILGMLALRLYTTQYGTSVYTLAEIGIVIFLPLALHAIRWTRGNYEKHKGTISDLGARLKLSGSGSRQSTSKREMNSQMAKSDSKQLKRQSSIEAIGEGGQRTSKINQVSSHRPTNLQRPGRGILEESTPLNR